MSALGELHKQEPHTPVLQVPRRRELPVPYTRVLQVPYKQALPALHTRALQVLYTQALREPYMPVPQVPRKRELRELPEVQVRPPGIPEPVLRRALRPG